MGGDLAIGDVTAAQIEMQYLSVWHDDFRQQYGRAPAPNTQRNHIQALRSFYAWADRFDWLRDGTGALARNPMTKVESVPVKRRLREWLRPDEFDALLLAAVKPNERILVSFFGFTGMRLSEATAMQWRDLNLITRPGTLAIGRATKTSTGVRTIPLLPELRPFLVEWHKHLSQRESAAAATPILSTKLGTPVTQQHVATVLARVATRAGLEKRVTPQTLRRTFGSTLLNKGVSIEVVSKMLGHSNTRVTEDAYAEMLPDRVFSEVLLCRCLIGQRYEIIIRASAPTQERESEGV
jgi:integrase